MQHIHLNPSAVAIGVSWYKGFYRVVFRSDTLRSKGHRNYRHCAASGSYDTDFFNKADMTESSLVQDKRSMADPADVAKDGYAALMAGRDKIVSGSKNKMKVGMSHIMPDSTMADMMNEQHKPVDKEKNSVF